MGLGQSSEGISIIFILFILDLKQKYIKKGEHKRLQMEESIRTKWRANALGRETEGTIILLKKKSKKHMPGKTPAD